MMSTTTDNKKLKIMLKLSNHTVKYINERIEYSNKYLKIEQAKEDFETRPSFIQMLERDVENFTAMLEEAENRVIVGIDTKDNSRIYIEKSQYDSAQDVLWVEDKPSGWRIEKKEVVKNNIKLVCYDGDTKWYGTLRFTKTL